MYGRMGFYCLNFRTRMTYACTSSPSNTKCDLKFYTIPIISSYSRDENFLSQINSILPNATLYYPITFSHHILFYRTLPHTILAYSYIHLEINEYKPGRIGFEY